MTRTLLITPLAEEQHLLVEGFRRRDAGAVGRTIGPIAVHDIQSLGLVVAHGGHGKTQFGIQTRYLLDALPSVERVVCVGAAGGLAGGVAIGDLVVALATHEHDYWVRFVERPQPRFAGDPELLEQLRGLPPTTDFQIHFGIVASGDEDIVDRERGAALHEQTGALAVAWEGAGGARACALSGTPFVEIRGVTDSADHDAATDFETNLALAMDNVADLVGNWLRG
jgi:adenosylhomocysteine nucleosidase